VVEVKVGDLTINPGLNKEFDEIHPAIGVVGDTAYVGVWIPCQVTDKKGNIAYRDLLFLVTDKRELILANDQVFREKGSNWRIAYKPIRFPNRWRLQDIQAYLNGATVDPAAVFIDLVSAWQKYMEQPNIRETLYHALWDMGTYFFHLFNCFPYHYIGGLKRSGKTKDLTVHYCLAFNAVFSNNMSTASIYRLTQNARATLLIDESEKLAYKGQMSERTLEFRSLLLSGYKRSGRTYRTEKNEKDRLQPQPFEVYSPKAVANIQGLEDVMEDRCKTTILKRSRDAKIANLEVDEGAEEWSKLRNKLYVLFLTFWREIKEIYDKIGESSEPRELVNPKTDPLFPKEDLDTYLVGRELELWKGIVALALFLDGKNVSVSRFTGSPGSLILKLAIDDAKQRQIENVTETGEIILVQILTQLVQKDDYYSIKMLKEEMAKAFDEEQKWLTTQWIGNALRRLGFKDKRRIGTGYQYLLSTADVEDLAKRLGLPSTLIFSNKFSEVKEWVLTAKNQDSLVDQAQLAAKCTELGLDTQRTVETLKEEGILSEAPNIGKFVVNNP
jgi:hypothetical protein